MQLGFVTAILPELGLNELAECASNIGYDCIEVMCWPPSKAERRYAGITHINVIDFDERQRDQIRETVDRYGVEISSLGYYPNALTPDPDDAALAVEHIRRVIRACAMLGLTRMTTFVGRDWTKSVQQNWPRFLETWRPIVAFAEEQGVHIGIENCPMLFTADEWPGGKNLATTPVIWRRMFNDIPSLHFGLNYDPSHMIWQRMDPIAPIREFHDRFVHVHAKDVRLDRERLDQVGILAHPNEYHTPKLPGLGDVNWGRFFSALTDAGYGGPVCVEVEDRAYEGSLALRKRALKQSHDFLRNYVVR